MTNIRSSESHFLGNDNNNNYHRQLTGQNSLKPGVVVARHFIHDVVLSPVGVVVLGVGTAHQSAVQNVCVGVRRVERVPVAGYRGQWAGAETTATTFESRVYPCGVSLA